MNTKAQIAIDAALAAAKQSHAEWHSMFEDSRLATASPIDVDELIDRAPNPFLAGLVAGAAQLARQQ